MRNMLKSFCGLFIFVALFGCSGGGSGGASTKTFVITGPQSSEPVILAGEPTITTFSVYVSGSTVELLKLENGNYIKVGDNRSLV